jgi:hypothetical protein
MKRPHKKKHIFDKPENVTRFLRGFYFICALLFLLDFILHRHITHSWENAPVFYALFGFIACVALVLLAKLMRKVLMRKEDYYDVDQ